MGIGHRSGLSGGARDAPTAEYRRAEGRAKILESVGALSRASRMGLEGDEFDAKQEFVSILILKATGAIDSIFKSEVYCRGDPPVFSSSFDGPACLFSI